MRELGLADKPTPADLTAWRALVDADQAPQAAARDRARRQVHRAARRLPVASPRRCATPAGRRAARSSDPLGRLGGAHRRTTTSSSSPARPACSCRRLRPSRHRGQGARRALRARAAGAVPRACAWACSAAVIEFARDVVGAAGRQLDRVRHVHQRAGDRLHARPARDGGQGRHDAPRASTRRG